MKFCITLLIIAVVSMTKGSSLRSRYLDADCPRVCTRTFRPVCAKLNGIPMSISNKCMLKNLIHCESSNNKIWEFVHTGVCQKDDETSEAEDADSESNSSEDEKEFEDGNVNSAEDGHFDEVFHWSLDYELREE